VRRPRSVLSERHLLENSVDCLEALVECLVHLVPGHGGHQSVHLGHLGELILGSRHDLAPGDLSVGSGAIGDDLTGILVEPDDDLHEAGGLPQGTVVVML
jgi:hypothetical protein